MRWTRFIDKKTVVLLKTRGKSLSLRKGETYTVGLNVTDASGNWVLVLTRYGFLDLQRRNSEGSSQVP